MSNISKQKYHGFRRPWLKDLLIAEFFGPCSIHEGFHKNECNRFCLDCGENPICSSCTLHHKEHNIVQIRRSSYHDVIRISEIQKFLDTSRVQTYVINSARVIFLNQRPQIKPSTKAVNNVCRICERHLLDGFKFCSLGCKAKWALKDEGLILKTKSIASTLNEKRAQKQNGQIPREELKEESGLTNSSASTDSCASILRIKGRKRKGIPRRAPWGS